MICQGFDKVQRGWNKYNVVYRGPCGEEYKELEVRLYMVNRL